MKRYNFTSQPLRGFNDDICIKDIIECKKYDGERHLPGKYSPYAIPYFDWDDLVQITVYNERNDKIYYVPVQNSDDFIEKVNERMKAAKGDMPAAE